MTIQRSMPLILAIGAVVVLVIVQVSSSLTLRAVDARLAGVDATTTAERGERQGADRELAEALEKLARTNETISPDIRALTAQVRELSERIDHSRHHRP